MFISQPHDECDVRNTERMIDQAADVYPEWVCEDCGWKYGRRHPGEGATWHHGTCGICHEQRPITQPRDFGHLR